MAGEINGTNIVIQNGTGEIVGQMETTLTMAGTLIDISNKSNGDFITNMAGALAGKQLNFSGTLVYNSNAQYQKVRLDALSGTPDTYTITYPGTGNTTDESFTGLFTPNAMSDTIPYGANVSTSMTFSSSGAYVHTPYVA
tara:strand:- start:37 stop:456 length:420 start_codon:yes stop_codon:yes gene_type:complete